MFRQVMCKMGGNNLTFSSSVIGISYGEMNSIKSNLRRANDMLMQSQSKINSARLKVQVDRGSSRLRVSEEQLNDLYRNAAKRKTKIDKLCNNIDITIRKFKEVDARCAARIRAIGKSADPNKSLWERVKTSVTSFMAFAANGLESIFEEGKEVYESLGTENKKTYSESSQNKYGYNFLSDWMNSNALATISTGAFAYKSSTSIFDEGRSIFSKLGTSYSINPYENFINGIRTDKYGDVPYIKSKTYISQATDEEVKEIERQQRDENPQPGDYGDGLWGKFAYTWLSLGNRLSQWEEQNQAFMNFATIVPAILSGAQVAMENEAASNYDMLYEEEQANIRERVSQNIEESKTAREASNYKEFAEFENGFKGAGNAVDELLNNLKSGKIKLHELSSDEQLKVAEVLKDKGPLKIEGNADINIREKNGYDDIQYKWSDGGYNYEMRWHTATPNAPEGTPPNWRVDRSKPGFPGGKDPVTGEKLQGYPSVKEVLIWPENGEPYYVSQDAWRVAGTAYRKGIATQEQLDMLKFGHYISD
jgi:hypothetical protein